VRTTYKRISLSKGMIDVHERRHNSLRTHGHFEFTVLTIDYAIAFIRPGSWNASSGPGAVRGRVTEMDPRLKGFGMWN
jgi:hypothetical protein